LPTKNEGNFFWQMTTFWWWNLSFLVTTNFIWWDNFNCGYFSINILEKTYQIPPRFFYLVGFVFLSDFFVGKWFIKIFVMLLSVFR
jgi:hypothetical protein